jgi:hypothetical protein
MKIYCGGLKTKKKERKKKTSCGCYKAGEVDLQRWEGEVVVCKRLEGGGFTVEKKRKLHL